MKILPDFNKVQFRSNFIRNCAMCALNNNLVEQLISAKAEKLVIDLAEERIPKARITNIQGEETIIANHVFYEPMRSLFGQGDYTGTKMESIRFNELPWAEVKQSYTQFVNEVTSRPGGFKQEDIVLIEVYMARDYLNEEYKFCEFNLDNSAFSQEYIKEANDYLKKCYMLLKELLPRSKVIRIPENIFAVYYNRWGNNPLHFNSSVYNYLLECINIVFENSNSNTLESVYADFRFQNHIIRKMIQE